MIVEGIPSGDHECWVLLVDAQTFKRVRGRNPDKQFDVGPFAKKGSPYRYMLNSSDLIGHDRKGELVELKIEVTVR